MTQFAMSWTLSRQRLIDEIKDLNDDQLQWRLHPGALSIGEMALHVAGVEVSFTSQMMGATLSQEDAKLKLAATEGVVNANPFPYGTREITASFVGERLERAKSMLEPVITDPSKEALERQMKSALGPIITGEAALARLGFHAAYHQGQAYLIKTSPGFPLD